MAVTVDQDHVADVHRYRFDVDEFARMGEAGIDGEPGPRPERFADLLPPRGGQEDASNRPKFFAPSMARLPVWISSRTLRNSALSQRRRSVTPSWRMSGCSAAGAKSSGAWGGTPRRPAARCSR